MGGRPGGETSPLYHNREGGGREPGAGQQWVVWRTYHGSIAGCTVLLCAVLVFLIHMCSTAIHSLPHAG